MELHERIKTARERAGLSLREAAKAMRIAPSTLLRWEDGTYSPRILDIPAICEAVRLAAAATKFLG